MSSHNWEPKFSFLQQNMSKVIKNPEFKNLILEIWSNRDTFNNIKWHMPQPCFYIAPPFAGPPPPQSIILH